MHDLIQQIDGIVEAFGDGCLNRGEATFQLECLRPVTDYERAAIAVALETLAKWGV